MPTLRTREDIRKQTQSPRRKLMNRVRDAYADNGIPWEEEIAFFCARMSLVELTSLALHWERRAYEGR